MTPIQQKTQIAYPTFEKFLESYKPAQLMVVYEDITNITRSVGVIIPRLRLEDVSLVYSTGRRNAGVEYLDNWLKWLNQLSNLNKQLTETKAVAFMLYNKYKHFYFSDLKLILEKILECEYGIFYGSVDAPRILEAFLKYNQERTAEFKRIVDYVSKEKDTYMRPLCESEFKAIRNRIKGDHADEKELRNECNRLYQIEALPKLDKIGDEIEQEILNKLLK